MHLSLHLAQTPLCCRISRSSPNTWCSGVRCRKCCAGRSTRAFDAVSHVLLHTAWAAHGARTRGCPVRSNPTGFPSARRLALVLRGVRVAAWRRGAASVSDATRAPLRAREPDEASPWKKFNAHFLRLRVHSPENSETRRNVCRTRCARTAPADERPPSPRPSHGRFTRHTRAGPAGANTSMQANAGRGALGAWRRSRHSERPAAFSSASAAWRFCAVVAKVLAPHARSTTRIEYLAAARPQPRLAPLR